MLEGLLEGVLERVLVGVRDRSLESFILNA